MNDKTGDGNDKKDDKNEREERKLIPLPGGKGSVNPTDIGADYVISPSKHVSTGEVVDPVEVQRDLANRVQYVKNQDLVRAVSDGTSTSNIIDAVLKEIAEELSHLKYERRKAAKGGKSTSSHTTARISGLRTMSEVLLKKKETLSSESFDIKSPKFQQVFNIWMEFFYDMMVKSGISKEEINIVFQQVKADMLELEKKIRSVE